MAVEVIMPALEMAQETGKVIAWRKSEGEPVAKGEVLLEIETDKAAVEVEAPADGLLAGVRAAEGAVIPVGQRIAWIVQPGEKVPEAEPAAGPASTAVPQAQTTGGATAPSAPAQPASAGRVKISPKARRLARERGVDISRLHGSGPDGEVLTSDVIAASSGATTAAPAAAAGAQTSSASTATEPLGSVGRLMAERTTQAWTTVPHFFVVRDVDAGALLAARGKYPASGNGSHRPTITDFLVALAGRVLAKHPRVNASWTSEGIERHSEVNVGVAVAVNDGVIAAVIPGADRASVEEIATRQRELAQRAKSGHLRPNEVRGATFTISNLGMYRVDAFTAIIASPQAAILAVGAIADRVVAIDGKPAVRPMMTMTLSCDHRVVDGAHGALFLDDLAKAIARPEEFLQ